MPDNVNRRLHKMRDNLLAPQRRRLKQAVDPTPAPEASVAKRVIARDGTFGVEQLALNAPTFHNKVTLHVTANESRNAILDAIKTSKETFWIEIFIWHNDESGRQIAQALIDRKKLADQRGETWDGKVLIDWAGLRDATNTTPDTEIVKMLKAGGIDVREFNVGGIDPTATGGSPITHRKLFIQDGTQYMTGGRNIGDEYLMETFTSPKGMQEKSWNDLLFTVEGDETTRIQREFLKNWVRSGGAMPSYVPAAKPAKDGNAWVQSVTTDPITHSRELREAQLKLIRYAESEVRLIYPYFSDDAMTDALIAAKKANPKLDIRVMMPGKGERGIPGFLYSNLNMETARQLLNAGIEVRFFSGTPNADGEGSTFSHFKGMVVDGKVMSLGSANGDARTLSQNHELNSLIYDKSASKKFIDDVMEPYWQEAKPITLAQIAAQPWWKKALQQVLELFDFIF